MNMFFLSWKYAKSRLANLIAMLTIAICVFVQVVVMAVLDGMLIDYKNRIQGLGEQLRIDLPFGANNEKTFSELKASLSSNENIGEITPVLQNYAMLNYYYSNNPVILRGIDIKKELEFGNIKKFLVDINSDKLKEALDKRKENGPPLIIIGARIAESMGIDPYDIITGRALIHVEFARGDEEKLVRQKFRVISRFRSSIGFYDEYLAYIPLSNCQDLFATENKKPVNIMSVWLKNSSINSGKLAELKTFVRKKADVITEKMGVGEVRIKTAEEMWHSAFEGMAHENALMEVVMAFISLACGFAIFAIMYTLVADRIRDIGILRSIGFSRFKVAVIFVISGLILGICGTVLGSIGGCLFAPHVSAAYEYLTGSPLYPPHLFGAEELYIYIDYLKVILRSLAAILVSVFASIPAAIWAGAREPLEALRHE